MNTRLIHTTLALALILVGCGQDAQTHAPCQDGEVYTWRSGGVVCEAAPEGLPGCAQEEVLVRRGDAWRCEGAPTADLECEPGQARLYTATGPACASPERLPECEDGESLVARQGELSCTDLLPACAPDQAVAVDEQGARCVDASQVPRCRAGELPVIHGDTPLCSWVVVRDGIVDVRRRTLDELVASPLYGHRLGVARNPMATPAMLERLASGGISDELLERDDTSEGALVTIATFASPARSGWRKLLTHPNVTDEVWRLLVTRNADALFDEVFHRQRTPPAISPVYMEMALESTTSSHRHGALERGVWPVARADELAGQVTDEGDFAALVANEGLAESTLALLVDRVAPGFGEGLVKNPALPTHLVDALVARAPYLRDSDVVQNPNASQALLGDLLARGLEEAVAAHPNASRAQRTQLASSSSSRVRRALCENPSLEPDEVDALVLDADSEVLRACAEHAPLSDANVATLSSGFYERRAMLGNPSLSSGALVSLAPLVSSQQRSDLLDHPSATQDVFTALFDLGPGVADGALSTHPGTSGAMLEAIWARSNANRYLARDLVDNPRTPAGTLAAIAAADEVFLSWYAREFASNPNTPLALLEEVANDELVVEYVAQNPSASAALLQTIYDTWYVARPSVAQGLCGNPNTPRVIVEELLYSYYHECAAANPALEVN